MKCTGCQESFDPGINGEVHEGSNENNIEVRVICPNKKCKKVYYTFIECDDLTEGE